MTERFAGGSPWLRVRRGARGSVSLSESFRLRVTRFGAALPCDLVLFGIARSRGLDLGLRLGMPEC